MNTYSNKSKTESATVQKKVSSKSKALVDNRAHTVVQRKVNTTGLPDQLKSGIESLSGIDMSDTKVHYNSSKPAQLNAHAYAQGTEIHVASGQEKHLPHEAWHVVQQKQGRVKPTMQMKGKVNLNDDTHLEKEADVMGARALQKKSKSENEVKNETLNNKSLNSSIKTVQLFKEPEGLKHLNTELHNVVDSFTKAHFDRIQATDPLYGSEEWGKDTFTAANRKLDEWGLVEKIFEEGRMHGLDLKQAAHIGFGIDDATEADAVVQSKHGDYLAAGENKLVTGAFSQVVENINSALSQLSTGSRAYLYDDSRLVARVNISPDSEAYKHLKDMETHKGSVFKGMQTRWKNRLINAHKLGKKYWKSNCQLGLTIVSGHEKFFQLSVS